MSVPITYLKMPESKYAIKCPFLLNATRIVVHNTANDASAMAEISYMNGNDYEVSYHYAVDDQRIVQGLPLDRNGWHAGDGSWGAGNREGIGIEICYSKSGGEKFLQAERNGAWLVAAILHQKGWGLDRVTKHQDYKQPWGYKYCPHRTLDLGWQRFLDMVQAELDKLQKPNYADNPNEEGQSTKFSRGEYVRTSKIATHFFQSDAIPSDFHDKLLVVDWLNADGTISVRTILDADGKQSEETYRMYERDLVAANQNPKQHFSRADKPDEKGRSTLFAVGQKVRTSGKATHYREGEPIEDWLHTQVLTVDYLNEDGSITVKPEIDTGARATFKRNLWEWDLTTA